ncbi:hypothetical protein [Spirosoma lituiforme]
MKDDTVSLQFFIGWYHGVNTEIHIAQNKGLYYRSSFPFQSTRFKELAEPVNVDSSALLELVKPCLIWQSNYESPLMDGIQWSLSILIQTTRLKCIGSNAYPEDFNNFVLGLEQVIGKPIR